MRQFILTLFFLAVVSFTTTPAFAYVIDFEDLANGEVVNTQYLVSRGLTISAQNDTKPFDLAVAFDSRLRGTEDPDLQGPNGVNGSWGNGNIPSNEVLGNLLIISEKNDTNGDGFIDRPDDEGSRPAGSIYFEFNNPILGFGFDLIDVEGSAEIFQNPRRGFFASFYSGSELVQISFADLNAYTTGIAFGDNSANRIMPFTSEMLGIGAFDKVVIDFGGSGAIDNIVVVTPEPSTFILLGAGLLAVVGFGRRRFSRN